MKPPGDFSRNLHVAPDYRVETDNGAPGKMKLSGTAPRPGCAKAGLRVQWPGRIG